MHLLCFNAPSSTRALITSLLRQPGWEETLDDPLILFVVILDGFFRHLKKTLNDLMVAFRYVERDVHSRAKRSNTRTEFEFVSIARISNHITNMRMSIHATLSTARRICEHHGELIERGKLPESSRSAQQLLVHKQTLLEGCSDLIHSLEAGMLNVSNLAFNTVNQQESRAMRSDSQAMKAISVMAMLFLPVTAVATIYGTNCFQFDSQSQKLLVAQN